jgi:surface polysaccharide O-acyltransferase-like enzyme
MEGLTGPRDEMSLRIVLLLVIVALASVITLWTLNPTGSTSESTFAIYLAVDLVSFAMISYVYRGSKSGDGIGRLPLIAGCAFISVLLFLGFLA